MEDLEISIINLIIAGAILVLVIFGFLFYKFKNDKNKWVKILGTFAGIVIIIVLIFIMVGKSNEKKPDYFETNKHRVIAASTFQVKVINEGLKERMRLGSMFAVKSNQYNGVYFVAAELTGGGIDREVGVWAISGNKDKDVSRLVFSANDAATKCSVFPYGGKTKFKISMASDGANLVFQYADRHSN